MKLLILKSNLIESLQIIDRAVPTSPNLPILENVLIKATSSKIILSGTNLEIGIECATGGKVLEEGEAAVPFRVLYDVAKNLNSEKISLELDDGRLHIQTDNYEASIQCGDVKEFPIIPGIESEDQSFSLPLSLLSDCLNSVIIATQFSEIRPEISGVYLSISKEAVYFVATDGFRLSERRLDLSSVIGSADCNVACIIPLKSASEIIRVLSGDNDSDEAKIIIEPHQIHFLSSNRRFVSRLTDGRFPDYTAIIPKDFITKIRINRQELHDAVKLVSSLSGKTHDLLIKSGDSGHFIELSSKDQARGENQYKVPVKSEGDPLIITFNWRYLLDGLKIFKSDDLEVCLSGRSKERPGPAVIRSEKEKNLLYVIMPIRN